MKLKKKVRRTLVAILLIALIIVCAFLAKSMFFDIQEVKETKVLKTIDKYGYTLKDKKTKNDNKTNNYIPYNFVEKLIDDSQIKNVIYYSLFCCS